MSIFGAFFAYLFVISVISFLSFCYPFVSSLSAFFLSLWYRWRSGQSSAKFVLLFPGDVTELNVRSCYVAKVMRRSLSLCVCVLLDERFGSGWNSTGADQRNGSLINLNDSSGTHSRGQGLTPGRIKTLPGDTEHGIANRRADKTLPFWYFPILN